MEDTIVKIDNLDIKIKLDEGILTPVRGVSLSIRENEALGLVGESGCGKSLTSKAILGINDKKCVTTGRIDFNVDGEWLNLLDLDPKGATIRGIRGKMASMIFQEPMSSFSPLFKIGSQISEPIRLHITKDKKQAKELAIKAMREVGISNPEERYSQYPHEFSGGMLQRALIAMALVCNPKLLIADEPTTALDVTIQAQILDLMKRLQKEYKMAILYVTHDLGTVARMCDRVAVMYLGRIVEMGTVMDIFKNPLHPYTKGLLGSVHKIGGGSERLFSIEGTVPLAMNLENRCSFFERCTFRDEQECTKEEPHLHEVEAGHSVACTLDFSATVKQNIG
ncbi:MAG: ABC transporter ATP-binding protein [Limnochordia bacterium]|jgi:peptide/nickel transport system ATP-binding protein|nr:ABC transporter ATP-binding protein [Limnochordia bacterium]